MYLATKPEEKDILKFLAEPKSDNREIKALKIASIRTGVISIRTGTDLKEDETPVGSVEFVESFLSYPVKPDYFPDFAKHLVNRDYWISDKPSLFTYVKPADKFKAFDNFFYTGDSVAKKKLGEPPYFIQERITSRILNEFRYYITNGEVLLDGWYPTLTNKDPEVIPEAPELPLEVPDSFFGTLDLAQLENGDMTLIEAHPSYSCGYYGELNDTCSTIAYAKWLKLGWRFLEK